MKTTKSLSRRALLGLIHLSVLLIIGISSAVTIGLYKRMMTNLSDKAHGCALTIAESIDGESVKKYIEIGDRDEYYYQIREQMIAIKENFDLMYCYVYIPDEDGLWYIWDADDEGDNIIGDRDPYSDKGKELSNQAFSKNPVYGFITDSDKDYGDFMATCAPVYDRSGEPVALTGVDISTKQIRLSVAKAVILETMIVIVIMLLSLVIYYRKMKGDLLDPVLKLTSAANNMVSNITSGEKLDIDVHTGDEIDSLARSFEKMNEEIVAYISENTRITAEKERIGAELDMAKEIQAGQLPGNFPAFPDRTEFDIYATMTPAKEVGGDFYDFFFVDNDHLALVIADVSGKGVPAALFMMMSKILINNYAMMGLSPAEVLTRTNETICKNNKQKMFVTVWFGILEISTGKVTAANAGHEYPIIRQPDGSFELFKDKHGFVIGGIKNKKYKQYEFTLQRGGTLFVYTDGVPEATNAGEEMFGTARTVEVLNRSPDALPQQLLKNVHDAVDEFVGDAPQFDDLTMLGITLL